MFAEFLIMCLCLLHNIQKEENPAHNISTQSEALVNTNSYNTSLKLRLIKELMNFVFPPGTACLRLIVLPPPWLLFWPAFILVCSEPENEEWHFWYVGIRGLSVPRSLGELSFMMRGTGTDSGFSSWVRKLIEFLHSNNFMHPVALIKELTPFLFRPID